MAAAAVTLLCVAALFLLRLRVEQRSLHSRELSIPFLTTRGVDRRPDGETRYSIDVATLSAGRCDVSLRRGEELDINEASEATNGDISSRPVAEIINSFAGRAEQGIVVYVHGYNIGIERACRDAARLADATGYRDRLLLFSWPASRKLITYRRDEQRLAASTPAIITAIYDLGARYGYDNINIVAHSMGSRVALALAENAGAHVLPANAKFDGLILVAPDIDRDRFVSAVPRIKERVSSISVLAYEDDKLLLLSQIVNQNERLGQDSDLSIDDVEMIDVAGIEDLGFTGHLYHLENTRVGDLLRELLIPNDVD
jgi:esterase/lipase superfamily enzyme